MWEFYIEPEPTDDDDDIGKDGSGNDSIEVYW